jgi:16S rRNA (uracil1498-N3)-methyltransferase
MSDPGSTVPLDARPKAARLYRKPLPAAGATVELDPKQAHYLTVVLRHQAGDAVRVFNEADGEWLCRLERARRNDWRLTLEHRIADPDPLPDLWYLFAPLKHERLDYLAQKATEMGACRLMPVLTEHTHRQRLNLDRIQANMIEAAEQCGLVSLPALDPPTALDDVLARWPAKRTLVWCNEDRRDSDPLEDLRRVRIGPLAVLIGPEGGFSAAERTQLFRLPQVCPLALGPRILRADTAAVAALALIQATCGDWRKATPEVTD